LLSERPCTDPRRGNQQVLSVARKEPFSTPFLPLSRHSSGGEFYGIGHAELGSIFG
jgi:hypothetical protein